MAISDQITAINNAKQAIKTAIEAKGVTVGTAPLADYASKISSISAQSWIRPSDWLALPAITSTDQKFVGLHAIYPYGNFVTLTVSGAFTVDWGDGTVANYAAGTTAEHQYAYSNPALNGTLTTRGYKQAVVTLTMQSGQSFTSLNLTAVHSVLAEFVSQGNADWLDIAVAGSQISFLQVGPSFFSENATSAPMLLEQASILSANVIDASFMFGVCLSLQSIPLLNIGNRLENASFMFYACMALEAGPMFNTAQCVNFSSMFEECGSLKSSPLYDTSSAQNVSRMFYRCPALVFVPQLNTTSVLSASAMFQGCTCLQMVPLLNMSSASNVEGIIANAGPFKTLPAIDVTNIRPANLTYYYPPTLTQCSIVGLSGFQNFSGCELSAAALNEIYTKLGTAIEPSEDDPSSNQIDVSYCYGAAASNTSIATAKGWVVIQ